MTGNRDFLPGVQNSLFHRWHHGKGIRVAGDLFLDNTLMSFNQLKDKFELESGSFWGYLQICHFVNSGNLEPPKEMPVYCEIEDFLLKMTDTRHLISKAYLLFYSMDHSGIDHIWRTWEKDLSTEYIDDDWVDMVKSIRSIFTCNRLVEMQYKLLLRLYITPRILNKMNSNHSPLCNKCQSEIGTFMDCFWHCPVITKFWDGVVRKMGDIFKRNFTKDPVFFYLVCQKKTLL